MPGKQRFQCHCGDHIPDYMKGNIRMNVCGNFPHYADFDSKPYCLLHYPGKEKAKEFGRELPKKEAEGNDFRGIWFPGMANYSHKDFTGDIDFQYVTFAGLANFDSATLDGWIKFQEAIFLDEARFNSAKFKLSVDFEAAKFRSLTTFDSAEFSRGVSFRAAVFSGETDFNAAEFSGFANFREATFSDLVSFKSANFFDDAFFHKAVFDEKSQVSFNQTLFRKTTDFSGAIIKGYLHFEGRLADIHGVIKTGTDERATPVFEGDLNLKQARIAKPEQILFDNVRLSPSWFVDTDSRKFVFYDVAWQGNDQIGLGAITSEIEYLEKNHSNPHRMLAIACRQLAVNAEENNRYEEASKFRFMAMECQRLEYSEKIAPWKLHWWYWVSSGYGEIWRRALLVLLGIWFLFAMLYFSPLSSFSREKKRTESEPAAQTENQPSAPPKTESLSFGESLLYSLNIITLQKPEPAPAGLLTRGFVTLEAILGPLQAALLALAIRRKFMR
jgi:hypothetical protein